jgi:hypothetical protein
MRVVVVSKEQTDYARQISDYLRDFQRQTGRELEILDPDSRDGISFCSAYDILAYPTIIAVADDGQVQSRWDGLPLPTISEVSYYAQ